jgi:transposase
VGNQTHHVAGEAGQGDLARVAEIYRAAAGAAPTRAVQEALGVSRTTAIRRVMAARQAGLLPLTRPGQGRAFEAHEPRTARWADGSASWLACTICRSPWPCDTIRALEPQETDRD